ncbi:MAG: hypothetical protein RMK94_13665 [Armatimonadota bacterium]|nr:hypothetical protein [Armatimonadota bacterium]
MAQIKQAKGKSKAVTEWLSEPRNRLSALLTCFLALLAIFLMLAKNIYEVQRWLISWEAKRYSLQAREQLEQALQNDPPMGISLASLFDKENLFFLPNSPSLLLVVFGGCGGCEEGVVKEWAETLGNWETWRKEQIMGALVLQRDTEKVKKMVVEKGWKVTVIGDESGRITRALNAFFVPRAYGFFDGKLVWIQKKPKMDIVSVLEGFLKSTKGEEVATQVLNSWSAEIRERVWGKMTGHAQGGDKK